MNEPIEFELPDIGEGIAEGEIVAWHVEDGERVSEDRTVVEVETDKAVVDIPSPIDGTVRARLAEEGELVPVGETILTFERGGSTSADDTETTAASEGEPFVAPHRHDGEGDRHAETASDRAERRVPYTGVRRTIGERMERSVYTAPQVSHHDTVEASELVEIRTRLESETTEGEIRLTYLPFVMKACAAALEAHPALNAELDEDTGEIIRKRYYHLGVATDTDAGLMVPVVEDVDQKSLLEIARDVQDVVERARDRSIRPEEMEGGTFTVTNIGAIGGRFGTPILNYPEVAILGLGSLEERPRVVDGEVVTEHVLPISLTSDHRVVDGGDAARFTNEVKRYIENPSRFLLE